MKPSTNVRRVSIYDVLATINEGIVPKEPHFKCLVCDDGKFHFGGFAIAGKHSKERHPYEKLDVRIEMRWPTVKGATA